MFIYHVYIVCQIWSTKTKYSSPSCLIENKTSYCCFPLHCRTMDNNCQTCSRHLERKYQDVYIILGYKEHHIKFSRVELN